jgi:hypothetical protein
MNPGATPVETAVGTPSDAGSNPAAFTKLEAKEAMKIWLLFVIRERYLIRIIKYCAFYFLVCFGKNAQSSGACEFD